MRIAVDAHQRPQNAPLDQAARDDRARTHDAVHRPPGAVLLAAAAEYKLGRRQIRLESADRPDLVVQVQQRIDRRADILQTGPPPPPGTPVVAQLSRWDRMKDMEGVLLAFAEHVPGEAHLILAGPAVSGVADDPEAAGVLQACVEVWRELPHSVRRRVHLACIPMADPDEAAAIVNALQRHSTVVTQKSLAEGFGLTVVEAMWKRRPVVASNVGGIADQIVDGEHGLLVGDGRDLAAFGGAVQRILESPSLAARLGANAQERARTEFLGDRHLQQWGALFRSALGAEGERSDG